MVKSMSCKNKIIKNSHMQPYKKASAGVRILLAGRCFYFFFKKYYYHIDL